MPGHYLYYSKPEEIRFNLEVHEGVPLDHWCSAQFGKLEPGDHVWLVTSEDNCLFLAGHLLVSQVLDRAAAIRHLGRDDLFDRPWHIVAERKEQEPMEVIDINDLVPLLRFEGAVDRLDLSNGKGGLGQRLQTMRKLSLDSITEILSRWYNVDKAELMDDEDPDSGAGNYEGDPESRREVEEAAVAQVTEALEADGWQVDSVEDERCGYDLHCTRGGVERHVEVKGRSGTDACFILTAREYQRAHEDPDFELHLVTCALSEHPHLRVMSGAELRKCHAFEPVQYLATPLTDAGTRP